jgi:hypothetical protein
MSNQGQIDYDSTHCWVDESVPQDKLPATALEAMRVYEGGDDDGRRHMHVELASIYYFATDPAEAWGVFLRDVCRTISVALAEENDMTREQAEAIIKRGFNSGYTYLPTKQEEASDA